jgi:hypothetical protein
MKRVSAADVDTAAVFQLHMLWALAWHEWEDDSASSTDRHERTALELHAIARDNQYKYYSGQLVTWAVP